MVGAIVSFTSMAISGRAAGLTFDTFEIMTFRSIVGVLIVVTVAFATGQARAISRRHLGVHAIRNVFHFAGQNLWFYAITVIPLAQVFALEFTSPLWVLLLAALFLGERLTWLKAVVGAVGFAGVLVVLQPGSAPLSLGVITAAVAAICFAGSVVFTKRLTRTESILTILFWLTVMQLGFGIICAFAFDGAITWPALTDWPWLILIGIAGLTAHLCLTTALTLAPASVVMPIDFVRLPVIAIVGMTLYGEPLNWSVLIGALMIFGATYANILASQRRD